MSPRTMLWTSLVGLWLAVPPASAGNGTYDPVYPLETQSKPLFELLGSAEKVHYIGEGGHSVPWADLVRETLRWLDTYVGPVG